MGIFEELVWPGDFKAEHMVLCGDYAYCPGGHYKRKMMRFGLESFTAEVVNFYPSDTQAAFCTASHGFAVPFIDPWASTGKVARWSLDDMSNQDLLNVGVVAPSYSTWKAGFHD